MSGSRTMAVALLAAALLAAGCSHDAPDAPAEPQVNTNFSNIVAGSGASVPYGRTGQLGSGFSSSCVGAVQTAAMYMVVRDDTIAHNEFNTLGEWKKALAGFLDNPDVPPGSEYDSSAPPQSGLSASYHYWAQDPIERWRKDLYPIFARPAPQDGVFRADSCTEGRSAEVTMVVPNRVDEFVGKDPAKEKATGNTWAKYTLTLRWDGSTWRIDDVQWVDGLEKPALGTIGAYPATQEGRDAWRKVLGQTAVYQFANAGGTWGKP